MSDYTTNGHAVKTTVGQASKEPTLNEADEINDALAAGYTTRSVAGSSDVVLTAAQARARVIELTGLLTDDINVDLPSTTTVGSARAPIVYNNTTGSFNLDFGYNGGARVRIPQGLVQEVYHDGTNVYAVGPPARPATGAPKLASGSAVLGSAFSLTSTGTYQDTGLSVSLPAAGTYLITADVRGQVNISAGTSGYVGSKLYNSTDSADVADSETIGAYVATTGVLQIETSPIHVLVTVTAPKTIKLYAKRDGGGSPTFTESVVESSSNGRTRLNYVQVG